MKSLLLPSGAPLRVRAITSFHFCSALFLTLVLILCGRLTARGATGTAESPASNSPHGTASAHPDFHTSTG